MATKISKYKQIWLQVKTIGNARIVADRAHHATIIRQVAKKKAADREYRLMRDADNINERLTTAIDGNTITFTIKRYSIALGDL